MPAGTFPVPASLPEAGGPPATPAYAAPHSSTIDVFYTTDGIPTVWFSGLTMAFVDGELCSVVGVLPVLLALSEQVTWPWLSGNSPCSRIGSVVSLCLADTCSEEFTLTGEDASVRMEVPRVDTPAIEVSFVADDGAPATVEIVSVSFQMGSSVCLAPRVEAPVPAEALIMSWRSCRKPAQRQTPG